jgi:hypothetical protein
MMLRANAIAIAEANRKARREGCTQADHAALKASEEAFLAGTQRLPHLASEETYTESDLGGFDHWRNCLRCSSTLIRHVRARPVDAPKLPDAAKVPDAPPMCECQRPVGLCDCRVLFGRGRR